jgi:LEA14-like dessication related protein
MKRKLFIYTLIVFISAIFFVSCQVLKDISATVNNLQRVEFKLGDVSNFNVAGLPLSNKSKISDFGLRDAAKLTSAFAKKQLPASFTLGLNAKNPNDGSNTSVKTKATISNIDWVLYIDEVKTINGIINDNIVVPESGQTTTIPLNMNLDLYDFFGNKGYDRLINLALAIGGVNGSSSKIKLDISPTISTAIGPIKYPGRITVVNTEWKN